MPDRATSEQTAFNDGRMYEAVGKIHCRLNHVFVCPNARRAEDYWTKTLRTHMPGADVLEIGCYDGGFTAQYARLKPKRLIGIDISDVAIEKAKRLGVDARLMDANNLTFQGGSFDVVIGRAILHHLDYETALKEVHRVLRPGGVALFMEPLLDNPAAKMWRALTPKLRTKDELPLSRKKIVWGDELFSSSDHCYSGLISTAVGLVTSFLPIGADNIALRFADRLDQSIERTPLRYSMRMVVLVWRK